MAKSRVTFQSTVPPWECDIVEHFTVSFYYEKLDHATAAALLAAGLDPTDPDAPYMTRCQTRFAAELVKGDIYQIETVQLAPTRLGHRLINSQTAQVCTHFDQTLSGSMAELPGDGSGLTDVEWDGPEAADAEVLAEGAQWLDTGRDMMTVGDCSLAGRLSSSACIRRYSAGGEHLRSRIGMTRVYTLDNRVGFSTFSFDFRLFGTASLGTALITQSCVGKIGRSSLRIEHRLLRAQDGVEISRLTQMGVHLDLDARRPSQFPEHIASTAQNLLPRESS